MGRHGWIAHTVARILDLIRFRVARVVATVPGRLPRIGGSPPASSAATTDSGVDAHRADVAHDPDLPADVPGAERFEEPVAVLPEPGDTGMDGTIATGEERVDGAFAAPAGTGWQGDETLTFTPDASLDLVDEIEFAFEPEPHLRYAIPSIRDGADGALHADPRAGEETGPGWVRGDGTRDCPESFPIKGNGSSHIYHMPGQASYGATVPELCFATEEAAVAEGYRPVKRPQAAQ